MNNNSPWLTQIKRTEPFPAVQQPFETGIAIIGGGISGLLTAFQLLEHTDKQITVIEGYKIAHGATGHNAGNLTSMLEVSIPYLIEKHGEAIVRSSFEAIESSWDILEKFLERTNITEGYEQFIGHGGYATAQHLNVELANLWYYKKWNLWDGSVLVSLDFDMSQIEEQYRSLCTPVPKEAVAAVLNVHIDTPYIAAIPEKMAVANSAFVTESLLAWCLNQYPDRITFFEQSPVTNVHCAKEQVSILVNDTTITAQEVVLCTNGFEYLSLTTDGPNIDAKFHHNVSGIVGYMSGYEYEQPYTPSATWFYEQDAVMSNHPQNDDPYFYITKRPFEIAGAQKGLVVIGGPESALSDRADYEREKMIDQHIITETDTFAEKTIEESALLKRIFSWHGLMGYTATGLRVVGREPCAPRIIYNLGCNGVGIMPAFWASKQLVAIVNNEKTTPTLFDPRDITCAL